MDTMSEVTTAYARAVEQATRVVDGVRAEDMGGPTPCTAWNTRELLNHLVGSNLMMGAVGSGQSMSGVGGGSGTEAVAAMGDVLGDDAAAAYRSASSGALAAFTTPGALERIWALPFGEVPGAVAINVHLMETLAHTWDLAKATGQIDKLDPSLAASGEAAARMIVNEQARNDKGDPFGPEVSVPPDAPPYDRFAGFMGRNP